MNDSNKIMKEWKMRLAQSIIKARKKMGYSQAYVAQCLDIDQSSYSKIESGNCNISAIRYFSLCEILEINLLELLPELQETEINLKNTESIALMAQELQLLRQRNAFLEEMIDRIISLRSN